MTLWTVAHQVLLSMGFPRQEYWSGLQFPAPGDLPNLGIELESPVSPALAGGFFITESPGKPTGLKSTQSYSELSAVAEVAPVLSSAPGMPSAQLGRYQSV